MKKIKIEKLKNPEIEKGTKTDLNGDFIVALLMLVILVFSFVLEYRNIIKEEIKASLAESVFSAQFFEKLKNKEDEILAMKFCFLKNVDCEIPLLIAYYGQKAKLSDSEIKTLIKIAQAESNFNPEAVGVYGEKGLFQIRPEIWDGKNLFDKEENIKKAIEIYRKVGFSAWNSSQKCWKKNNY